MAGLSKSRYGQILVVLLENTSDFALFVEPAANAIVCVGVLCPGIVSYSPVPARLSQLDLSDNQNCHLKGIKLYGRVSCTHLTCNIVSLQR